MNMNMKALRRVVLMVVALVASSLSLVTVASPAHADTYTGKVEVDATVAMKQGGTATVAAAVTVGVDGVDYYVPVGTATLQQLPYGARSWSTVTTATLGAGVQPLRWTVRPAKNTQYRVLYSGGSYTNSDNSVDTFTPATSRTVQVGVARHLNDKFKKRTRNFSGKIASYGRKPVLVQKSTCANPKVASCKWKKFRTVKTNAKGAWSTKLTISGRKTHFRAVVKAGSGYITSYSNYVITTWRY